MLKGKRFIDLLQQLKKVVLHLNNTLTFNTQASGLSGMFSASTNMQFKYMELG